METTTCIEASNISERFELTVLSLGCCANFQSISSNDKLHLFQNEPLSSAKVSVCAVFIDQDFEVHFHSFLSF